MTSVKIIWTWYFLALVGFQYYAAAAPAKALISSVPGYDGSFLSKQYGGYVTVDEDHGRFLYYYFVTSQGNPAKDPVVLWLNGGPGCSSFDGFIYEHGPFNFEAGNNSETLPKLHPNPYAWSKVSSVIYLDSPSGVGFSYSRTENDYNTGDYQTANDTHKFLLKWFEEYPEFLSNPFFIAGESYAGIYVPTLASKISEGIAAGVKPVLNFKGYMVGNGVTDPKFDGNAFVPFVHGMGLISDDIFQEAKEACKENYWNTSNDINCDTKINEINELVSRINVYDILEPCYHDTDIQEVVVQKENLPESFKKLGETGKPHPVRRRIFGRAWPLRAPVLDGIVPTWPQLSESVPCFDDRVATVWLNDESVRKAIHAETKAISGDWQLCSDRINYNHDAGSMIRYHINLTSNGYRALIYSGDHDMCVPFTGSEAWTRSLGYAITDSWRPWILDGQVAGYTQGYAYNLTFATIKGSGHTVPEYKPAEALAFFTRFIAGEPL